MVLDAPLTVQPRAASPVSFATKGGNIYHAQVSRAATGFLHDFSRPAISSLNNSSTIPFQYTHTVTACNPHLNIPLLDIDRFEHTGLEVSTPFANIGNKPRTTVAEVRFASPLTQAYSPAHVSTATPESVSAVKTKVTPLKSDNNVLIGASTPNQKNILKPQRKEEEKKVVVKPTLHPKTIAFGKTVNVSQTVEATSRAAKTAKRLPSMSRVPIIRENKENEKSANSKEEMTVVNAERKEYDVVPFEDLYHQLAELRAKDEERSREIKRLEEKDEERAKQMEKLKQRDCDRSDQLLKLTTLVNDLARKQSQQLRTSPVKRRDTSPCLAVVPSPARVQKNREASGRQTQVKGKTGGLLETNLEILQKRLQEDPLFRQTILDVLADEADKPQNNSFEKNTSFLERSKRETPPTARENKDSQSPVGGGTFTKNTRRARTPLNESRHYVYQSPERDRIPTFTQKVTVERKYHGSGRFGTNYSVDTKRFLEENILIPESIISTTAAPAASVYQPGESVTYYPSNDKTNKARYTVESPVEDEDCEFNDVIRTPRHEDPVGRRERLDRVRERRMARTMRGTVNDTDF